MTAQLDHWATTDHDPTSHLEAIRHLTVSDTRPTSAATPDIDEAIRRMHGRLDIDLIAWRLYTTSRTVHRVAARLGLTTHKPPRTDEVAALRSETTPASPRARAIA